MKTFHKFLFGNAFTVLLFLVFAGSSWAQPQHYNYQNVGTSSNLFPFNVTGGKAVQGLFLPGEFSNPSPAPAGVITRIYVYTTTTAATTYTNLEIKMGQSSITDLPASWVTGLTTVYSHASANLSSTANSWMSIDLDTPFPYDPGMSLIVEIGQCGSTGAGPNLRHNILTGFKRSYSIGGCPFVYSSQTGHTLNFGVDIGPAGTCNYSWASQTSGTSSALNTVKSVNSMIGWAAGAAGTVRRTTDGGTTWTDGNPNPGVITGDIYAIEALGADTAWCTTSPGATFIYRTTNGGANWTQVHTQTGGFWNIIKFQNSSVGFIEGDPVGGRWSLWRTSDGGATWDSSGMFNPQAGSEAGWNNSAGLIGNNLWYGTNNTRIYYSTNFGASWNFGATTGNVSTYSLHFNSPTLGLGGGTSISKTTDGGATYGSTITVPGSGNILGIGGDGNNFWCGRGAAIYKSTDAGDTWASDFTPSGTVNSMDVVKTGSCASGWAVGTAGSISRLDGTLVSVHNNTNTIPNEYKLAQNYPNPFNPSTTISYDIPKAGLVQIKIYDMLGREVATLVNEVKQPGIYRIDFDGTGLASGVYVYRLKAGEFYESKKMSLIK